MRSHTIQVNAGETIADAMRRLLADDALKMAGVGAEAIKQGKTIADQLSGDFALTVLEGLLEMQGVVQHMHDYAERKLGRKAVKKIINVSILSGLLVMPVPTIDPDDIEWFRAVMEGLAEVFADIQKIDLAAV